MTFKDADLKRNFRAIVIGGSAGSFQVMTKILGCIPKEYPLPIILCSHRLKHVKSGFVEALTIKSHKEIVEPLDKDAVKKGKVYLAPSNYHLNIEIGHTFSLSTEEMVNNSRPSIDITLETAAYAYKDKLLGILLTGANKDGAKGMKKIADYGGVTIVQDPKECLIDTMPKAALEIAPIDYILSIEEIIKFILQIQSGKEI